MLRADSAQYHKLNGDTALQLSSGDDLNLLPNGIAYTTDGGTTSSLLHIPPGITATSAVIITESGNGVPNLNAFRIQTMRIRHNNQIFVRFSGENGDGSENWYDWVKIPLCQPPQSFSLPAASGVTGASTYRKTQESLVIVDVDATKSSGFSTGETIGTLPAGFRPAKIAYGHASGQIDIELAVQPTGEVQVRRQSGSGSIDSPVAGQVVFFAAN